MPKIRAESRGNVHPRWRPALRVLVISTVVSFASAAFAADPDVARARQLVVDGKYQEAYDLLAPFESASAGDADFTYLLGRAALGMQQGERAKTLFETQPAVRARPPGGASRIGPCVLPARAVRGSEDRVRDGAALRQCAARCSLAGPDL